MKHIEQLKNDVSLRLQLPDRIIRVILELYLFFLGFVLPLYMYDGYIGIGYEKFTLWRFWSLLSIFLIIIFKLIHMIWKVRYSGISSLREHALKLRPLNAIDICMILYAAAVTVSFITSIDHEEALWGTFGWNTGWLTQMTLVFFYFCYAKLHQWKQHSILLFLSGSVPVILLSILQRFGLFLFNDGNAGYNFLSTIGNINWLCGYLSVMIPFYIGMYIFSDSNHKIFRIISGVYIYLCCLSLLLNGSNATFLILISAAAVCLFLAVSSGSMLTQIIHYCFLFGLACESVSLLRMISPELFHCVIPYEDHFTYWIALHHIGLIIMIITAVILILLHNEHIRPLILSRNQSEHILQSGLILSAGLIAIFTVLQLTGKTGLGYDFGNHRGAIWEISRRMYEKLPLYRKLFGVGPDCYSIYNLNDQEIFQMMADIYAKEHLTNAHNEYLTMMISIGACGMLFFCSSMFLVCRQAIRLISHQDKTVRLIAAGALFGLAGVSADYIVSFQHIILIPYIFLLFAAVSGIKTGS